MSEMFAERFIEALHTLEADRNPEPLVTLFAPSADTGNVIVPEKFHGPEGAREFWTKYRDTFQTLNSTFRNQIVNDGRIALEWSTHGTSATGSPLAYDGVSILEVEGDHITRFRAYYDPSALAKQIEPAIASS